MEMFFNKDINILADKLELFRECFSKPQWNHFVSYTTGLIVSEKGEKNVQDMARNSLDGKSQSSLNRFITRAKWQVSRPNAIRLREYLPSKEGGFLILDDTLLGKTGVNMEGVGYLYDPSSEKNVLCHNIVSTFYSNGKQKVPLYFVPYLKKEIALSLDIWFKTKVQLGIELLKKALAIGIKPTAILMDAWWFGKDTIHFANSHNFTLVSEAKSNRCISINDDGWISLSNFYRSIPHEAFKRIDEEIEEKRYRWYYEVEVVMKNAGKVKIVILKKRKNSRRFKALVTNNLILSGTKIIKYYKKRWDIEVFYRDCKQHLGMEEYQLRKLDAVVIHLHLVFLAYTLLKNVWYNPFLRKILRGLKSIGAMCSRIKRKIFDKLLYWVNKIKKILRSKKEYSRVVIG